EYLDNTVKTEDDIEKRLGLPVLGTIATISEEDIRADQLRTQKQMRRRGGRNVSYKKENKQQNQSFNYKTEPALPNLRAIPDDKNEFTICVHRQRIKNHTNYFRGTK